ncbi:MAG: CPBP family intramembrane metalloprotease [Verrucomicrobiaceae bacterium]|nr:CPBP family intramembrane metalloprotease [Verrucomicrobiaceae bacterium]
MPDSATLAVLRDVASFIVVAVALGIAVYGLLRMARPALAWNDGGAVLARPYSLADIYVGALLASYLLSGLAAAPAPGSTGTGVEMQATFHTLLLNIVFMLALCVLLLLYLVVLRGLNPADLFGLHRLSVPRAALRALGYIIPVYAVITLIAVVVTQAAKDVWPDSGPQDVVKAFRTARDLPLRVIMLLTAVIVAPLVEETVFRGFIYGVLKRYTDGWFAALCSAALFALVHMHVGSFVPLFVLALGFCAAYERTGCLLVPMFMHAFFNGTSTALLWFFPNIPN